MNSTVTEELRGAPSLPTAAGPAPVPASPQVGVAGATKRILDFTLALALAIAITPLVLIIAIAVVVESAGPVFFCQKRMGRGGQIFTVIKFRSMYRDAEARLHEVSANNEITDGPTFKWRDDPRITRVGRLLRRTSLDELPQIYNVLLGNMSLVGPRPPLESEVLKYEPWQLERLAVKPGMTGLWQVSGRSELGFLEMVLLDIDYVRKWSVRRDVVLLVRTPWAVIKGRGAY